MLLGNVVDALVQLEHGRLEHDGWSLEPGPQALEHDGWSLEPGPQALQPGPQALEHGGLSTDA